MLKNLAIAFLPLAALVLIPIWLRSKDTPELTSSGMKTEKLVVITPHAESIKHELNVGFQRYCLENYGRRVEIDYRSPGGTSDIVRYIADRYLAEFKFFWQAEGRDWDEDSAKSWNSYRNDDTPSLARQSFLTSDIGIGIDIFAGGGTYEHIDLARRGFGVDGGVQKRHPEYFAPEIIPAEFGGESIYDQAGRYYGVCLASFGICYNCDRMKELADPTPPMTWADLAKPKFFNLLVSGDPTKSGSINKCFEIIIQQEMGKAAQVGNSASGWDSGMNLIKLIIANSRSITGSAGQAVRQVASGEATAGMAIDFYGFSEEEWTSFQRGGVQSQLAYIPPVGGSSISADPIMLLRGAPNRELAEIFLDYSLSEEGQKIYNFKQGTPGGPVKYALRRAPVRLDLYEEKYREFRSDPDYNPYHAGGDFTYRPEFTGRYFNLLRVTVKCIMLDVHGELAMAWGAIIDAGGPSKVPEAYAALTRLPYSPDERNQVDGILRDTSEEGVLAAARMCRDWMEQARSNYLLAAKLAREGK